MNVIFSHRHHRRLNSQNEYERDYHEFSSVVNDDLDACLSGHNKPVER